MAEHTPGPWHVVERPLEFVVRCCTGEGDLAELSIADRFGPDYETCRADARLMAAAPELLAACEAVLSALCLPDEGGVRMLAAESLVRGAIAKAKGHLWHQ